MSVSRFPLLFLLLLLVQSHVSGQDPRSTEHREGLRENRPSQFALTDARIVISPGRVLEKGTLLLRDGKIDAVLGKGEGIPKTVRRIDCAGKTIYPGLMDGWSEVEIPQSAVDAGASY